MIRTPFDDATRDELHALRRDPLAPKVRDRIEMVLLSDASWSAPRIAAHLEVILEAREGLADRGIYLYFLPPYSPELNRIEPVFRQMKHQEIPQRSHTTRNGLREAVEASFNNYAQRLRIRSQRERRPAA